MNEKNVGKPSDVINIFKHINRTGNPMNVSNVGKASDIIKVFKLLHWRETICILKK